MNANAQKWVQALRSGDYKQTRNVLTEIIQDKSFTHCCLGVACEVAIKSGLKLDLGVTFHGETIARTYNDSRTLLPEEVREWLGLASNVAGLTILDVNTGIKEDTSLALLNDNGASFEEIAELIEAEPEGLFVAPASS